MSPRIWLSNAHGLRISKAGIDVTQATAAELAFDSANNLPWLWFAGTSNIPAETTGTLTFPTTLSEPPLTFAAVRVDTGEKVQIGTGHMTVDFNVAEATVAAQLRTFRDRFELVNNYPFQITVDYQGYRLK